MIIKQINTIRKYRSYTHFNGSQYKFNERLNCFLGENGSGKSSIIDILKNLSNNRFFGNKPGENTQFG